MMQEWQAMWYDMLGFGWQDWVIGAIQWIFLASLIPTVRHPTQKPPLITALLTGSLLILLGFVVSTLGLLNSTIASFAVGSTWLVIAWQRYCLDCKPQTPTLLRRNSGDYD